MTHLEKIQEILGTAPPQVTPCMVVLLEIARMLEEIQKTQVQILKSKTQ